MKLTTAKIRNVSKPGLYGDGGTLYLRVTPTSKNWIQRLFVQGRQTDLGLGGWPLTSLIEAREKAFHNRKLARSGGDPRVHKRQQVSPTFSEALEKVLAIHEPTWKDGGRTAQSWRGSLRDHAATLYQQHVSTIRAEDVLAVLEKIWHTKHATAGKVKRRISSVMDWALLKGYRTDNPCTAVGVALPKADLLKGHYKTIPVQDVPVALSTIRHSAAHPSTRRCFELQVLTATRSSEVRLATWEEFDLNKAVWEIPAARMKAGKTFRIPLSQHALDLLWKQRPQSSGLVFPSIRGRVVSDTIISKLVRENGIQGVPHAIARACFRSWCAEQNVAREVAEACLAHAVKGVEASYQRSDLFTLRRGVMERWADFLLDVPVRKKTRTAPSK